ncbi:hypothetical protein L1049_012191 [Liquidambar formosana]|uniref:Uncharacterized protein n=1 Tax=Liquidambar formosana TaxID=63359 RepID=A0AAP0RTX3_LIQFO
MATTYKLNHLVPTLLVFLVITSQSSSARVLLDHGSLPANSLAATQPELNLALPGDNLIDASSEKNSHHGLPCDMGSDKKVDLEAERSREGLMRKYGPLFLNMLPKGPLPPSGPSPGINGEKN